MIFFDLFLITPPPGKKNKLRVYYLSWLRNRILHNDPEVEKKQGWITVGDLEGCVHYKVGKDPRRRRNRERRVILHFQGTKKIYYWTDRESLGLMQLWKSSLDSLFIAGSCCKLQAAPSEDCFLLLHNGPLPFLIFFFKQQRWDI